MLAVKTWGVPRVCVLEVFCTNAQNRSGWGEKYINAAVNLFNWQPHGDSCDVCEYFVKRAKGGRPKKCRKNCGRVAGETITHTGTSIRAIASDRLVTASVDPSRILASPVDHSHLVCPLCKLVVNGPIQLTCETLVCGDCLLKLIRSKGPDAGCPSCDAQVTSAHLKKCPSVIVDLLSNLRIKCGQGCYHLCFPLRHLSSHEKCCIQSVTQQPLSWSTMPEATFGEVLASPVNAPLSPDEQRVCTHLVRRALHDSENSATLILRTGGQVCYKDNTGR